MSYNYNEIEEFLKLDLPESPEEIDTFLSIAGFPHYENVISNIYAYYFDSENSHGFNDLFLRALFNTIKKHAPLNYNSRFQYLENWSSWEVYREESVNAKRIDILLEENSEEESTFIIIENKIFHELDNPLDIYWSYDKTDKKIGIVLSMYKEKINHKGFINITHYQFLEEVKNLQGQYIEKANPRDFLILKDLIINLKQLHNMNENEKELLEFYQEHQEKVESVYELRMNVQKSFIDAVSKLGEKDLDLNVRYKNSKNYRGIVDKDYDEILLVFLFDSRKEEDDKKSIEIRLELHGDLEKRKEELLGNDDFFKKFKKQGINKDDWFHNGSWFSLASKYYSFSDLNYDLSNLKSIFDEEWKPLIKELKKLL